MKIKLVNYDRHRNGICGAPFYVVLFNDSGPERSQKLAILFDEEGHCAVFDSKKLAAGQIGFACNSWRGDRYEPFLRKALRSRERERDQWQTIADDDNR